MADLERSRSRTPRKVREDRAFRLGVATTAFGLVAVVGTLLALVGVIGGGLPVLAAIIAVACGLLFRRTVSG